MLGSTNKKKRSAQATLDPRYDAAGCLAELRAFCRGGAPGLERLHRVLPAIFRHYCVPEAQQRALLGEFGLRPHYDTLARRVSFYLDSALFGADLACS